jgi:hypothetical protein
MKHDHKAALELAHDIPPYSAFNNLAACYLELHTEHERLKELARAHCNSGGRGEHYHTEQALRAAIKEKGK